MAHLENVTPQRSSTAEVVADTLVGLIVSGSLQAGEPLRESTLAAELGISRNSLREGIRLLERSRLVKYELNRGAVVSTPTMADLQDLFSTRKYFELAAVQRVPDESQLQAIHDAFIALDESAQSKEAGRIVAADLSMHQAIVDLLGSKRISAFYREICQELVFYFTVLSFADEEHVNPQEPIMARHQEIYDAILRGDRATAADLLGDHIDQNFNRLAEIFTQRGKDVPVRVRR